MQTSRGSFANYYVDLRMLIAHEFPLTISDIPRKLDGKASLGWLAQRIRCISVNAFVMARVHTRDEQLIVIYFEKKKGNLQEQNYNSTFAEYIYSCISKVYIDV